MLSSLGALLIAMNLLKSSGFWPRGGAYADFVWLIWGLIT